MNMEFLTDPLRRFEYLKSTKQNAVMIRATPNSVRWDEINRVQYRFQALNFHSDVLEALIHNSPPLTRRERALTSPGKKMITYNTNDGSSNKSEDSTEKTVRDKTQCKQSYQQRRAHVRCVRRSASFDASHATRDEYLSRRKGSVVQILKDDTTSDYNSDEEVFNAKSEAGSLEKINYNATIVHVGNHQQITDTTEIQVTTNFKPIHRRFEEENKNNYNNNTYTKQDERLLDNTDGSNGSTISCNVGDVFVSDDKDEDDEDLYRKSKEELVMLVKQLKGELVHCKTSSLPSSPLISKPHRAHHAEKTKPLQLDLHSRLTSFDINVNKSILATTSRQNSEDGAGVAKEPHFSVSVLLNNFEKQRPANPTSSVETESVRTLLLTSPSGRVRALSTAFENEALRSSSTPSTPSTPHRKMFFPVVGKNS